MLEDRQIIELYWQKNADAISETASKYGAYCFTIAENILHNTEDSEECVNDTWLHAWNAIPPQKPNILRLFLAKITRNLSFDRFNARNAEKRGGGEIALVLEELGECFGGGADTEAAYEAKELREAIQRFVRALPEREPQLPSLRPSSSQFPPGSWCRRRRRQVPVRSPRRRPSSSQSPPGS